MTDSERTQIKIVNRIVSHPMASKVRGFYHNDLGMVSNKKLTITIFGYNHFNFFKLSLLIFFTKKFQQPLLLVHILNRISNFEAILLLKLLMNFVENGSCDQNMLLIKYFKYYII